MYKMAVRNMMAIVSGLLFLFHASSQPLFER